MAMDFVGVRGRRKQAKPQRKNVELEEELLGYTKDTSFKEDDEMKKTEIMCQTENNNDISDKRTGNNNNATRNFNDNDVEIKISVRLGGKRKEVEEEANGHGEDYRQETVYKVNGLKTKSDNFNFDNLLLKKTKVNGESTPSLRTIPSPVILVKTVNDLNNIYKKQQIEENEDEEERKIEEFMRRSDTAVIYPEPAELHRKVPLSPAAVKALTETDNPDYFIKCPQCQKPYSNFQSLKDHIETEHRLTSPKEATSPVTSHNSYSPIPVPIPGGLYPCPQCNASFSTKDQLEKHELLHSPNAQVSCKVCNKQFANVYRLQRHMISHDESAVLRKFKCPECEKAFKFKHHLKEHIRIHSGEKPFQCSNCGKRFSHSGSYSSHMTSKKCLVMNLKVNRGRGMDKTLNRNGNVKRNVTNNNNINNLKGNLNITTNNLNITTNNSFPSLIPKYGDAAAAFLSAVSPRSTFPSQNSGLHPFYMAVPPGMHTPLHPYSIPSLSQFLEHLTPPNMLISPKKEEEKRDYEIKQEREDDVKDERKESGSPGGDLEAVKRILETVNATVTKQLLQANMHKLTSSPSGSSCPSIASPPIGEETDCKYCGKVFQNRIDHHQHERYMCEMAKTEKYEGLAAKLENAVSIKRDEESGSEEDRKDQFDRKLENDKRDDCSGSEDEEKECEEEIERHEDGGITITTQEGGADGRKVRVRSLIADEQLAILKHHYLLNPRPKREELSRIADKIKFPVRVVQVWFQNTRARDRREGRLVQVPYLPLPIFQNNVPFNMEQPLDLSTKKSSQASSPLLMDTEDAMNLSQKTPPLSNGLRPLFHPFMDPRKTPSPLAYLNLHQEEMKTNSRLAKILSQPQRDFNNLSLVPVERLMHSDAHASRSPVPMMSYMAQDNGRPCSSSPSSDKRSWRQGDLTDETEDSGTHDNSEDGSPTKLQRMNGYPEEIEGQFICDQCDKAFSKQSSLARHKYEHSGQRPHKCEICDKAFKHKHHLTEHKRLHSGEKPFQCMKCLKRFSHSGSYSQHMNHRYSYCKPYRE